MPDQEQRLVIDDPVALARTARVFRAARARRLAASAANENRSDGMDRAA